MDERRRRSEATKLQGSRPHPHPRYLCRRVLDGLRIRKGIGARGDVLDCTHDDPNSRDLPLGQTPPPSRVLVDTNMDQVARDFSKGTGSKLHVVCAWD